MYFFSSLFVSVFFRWRKVFFSSSSTPSCLHFSQIFVFLLHMFLFVPISSHSYHRFWFSHILNTKRICAGGKLFTIQSVIFFFFSESVYFQAPQWYLMIFINFNLSLILFIIFNLTSILTMTMANFETLKKTVTFKIMNTFLWWNPFRWPMIKFVYTSLTKYSWNFVSFFWGVTKIYLI